MVKIDVEMPDTVKMPMAFVLKRKIEKIVREYVPEANAFVRKEK